MRLATYALAATLALVQAELWFGKGGLPRKLELQAKLQQQEGENDAAHTRNERLAAEVRDLKEGLEMVEEKARFELGMIKPDEIYVHVSGAQALMFNTLRPAFAVAFTVWGSPITWLEVVACLLAVWMVALNMRVNPLAWPLAITSSALYCALFWNSRLYGDAALQIFFAVVAAWGWRQWLRAQGSDGSALRVRALSHAGRWRAVLAFACAWPAIGLFLKTYTDTDVPWWDAFPTSASLIGQWLLGRKYIENWPVWLAVNAVSVALFAYKGLWLTVLLYGVFLVLSCWGWRAWQRLAGAA